jgi:hypothetical protein
VGRPEGGEAVKKGREEEELERRERRVFFSFVFFF